MTRHLLLLCALALAACTYTEVHQGPLDPREAQCRAACDVKRDECDRQSGGGRISGLTCDDEYQQCHAQCQSPLTPPPPKP